MYLLTAGKAAFSYFGCRVFRVALVFLLSALCSVTRLIGHRHWNNVAQRSIQIVKDIWCHTEPIVAASTTINWIQIFSICSENVGAWNIQEKKIEEFARAWLLAAVALNTQLRGDAQWWYNTLADFPAFFYRAYFDSYIGKSVFFRMFAVA